MFSTPFYFSLIRKYVILVGTLFNNIHITRTDTNGNTTALIKVPITYAAKDKMLARVLGDPQISIETAVTPLPFISFEMGKMFYDRDRKLNTIGRVAARDANNPNKFKYQYNPVPYNINFRVYVYAKHAEDGTKIIEQILPYFTPDWTSTVHLIPEMNVTMDVPIILNNINYSDNYDGSYKDRRAIIWELDLTLKGYLYGPVKNSNIIKFVETNFRIPNVPDGSLSSAVGVTEISERVTVQPGLTADGSPTSDIDLTVPFTEIDINDDFGYITRILTIEEIENE
jgi:hypothetical protein